jgi:hypothetical protein
LTCRREDETYSKGDNAQREQESRLCEFHRLILSWAEGNIHTGNEVLGDGQHATPKTVGLHKKMQIDGDEVFLVTFLIERRGQEYLLCHGGSLKTKSSTVGLP